MGTRSVIAMGEPASWTGVYCHWDGYPDHMADALHFIVNRDGYEQAVKTLVSDNCYWSSINPYKEQELSEGYSDGRFKVIQGYGVAGTEMQATDEDRFHWGDDLAGSWLEWLYVMSPDGIWVYDCSDTDVALAFVPWSSPMPNWTLVMANQHSEA